MKLKELPKLPRGMGGYDWMDDKHEVIRYRKQITVNGKKVNLSVSGHSISEVNKLMILKEEEKRKEIINACNPKKHNSRLQDSMQEWIYLYKKAELKDKSFDRVESTFFTHIFNSDIGLMQEQAITSDDLQRHMLYGLYNHKYDDSELSFSSKKKVYELLSQYFRYKYIKSPNLNPMLTVSRPKDNDCKKPFVVYDDNEMCKLTDVALQGKVPCGEFISFIMWTFIRIGEALALKWSDIDVKEKTLNINKAFTLVKNRDDVTTTKKYLLKLTSAKYDSSRLIKINDKAVESFLALKANYTPTDENEFIKDTITSFGGTLTYNSIHDRLKSLQEYADLTDKHVTLHGLRHCGISYMLRNGMSIEVVSKLAGHKSIQITIDTYYTVIEEQKLKQIEMVNQSF